MKTSATTKNTILVAISVAVFLAIVQWSFHLQLVLHATTRSEESMWKELNENIPLQASLDGETYNVANDQPVLDRSAGPESASTNGQHNFMLSVPFYVYEELVWETATWGGKSLDQWVVNSSNPKHTDDYWFMKAALEHPMRTKNISRARLFVIPTLNNVYDSRAFFKTKDLCWNRLCNEKLVSHAGRFLLSAPSFQKHPEAHLAVASHFAHHKTWWTNRLPSSIKTVLKASNVIGFEDHNTNADGLLHLPKLHVAKGCQLETPKTSDVAMIATFKPNDPRFRHRELVCQWLSLMQNRTNSSSDDAAKVDICGPGQMCPALSQAKLGFHVRGDTLSSNRLLDTLLSGTIPIFTLPQQYNVLPDFIDWRKISYFINMETTKTVEDFSNQLLSILDNSSDYETKHNLVVQHKDLFDWKKMYPFDLYMYRLQIHLFPETLNTLLARNPLLRYDWFVSPSKVGVILQSNHQTPNSTTPRYIHRNVSDLCPSSSRCGLIYLASARFSYVHISKNSGVSWIRELKKLKNVPKNLPSTPEEMRDNFPTVGLYPTAENGAEHGVLFQDQLLKDHKPFHRLITLRSPRHQIWSMFSHCYYSTWGKKATKSFFPRENPGNDLLDFEVWLDHFLTYNKTAILTEQRERTYGCYHPQNYQSRALVSNKGTPRRPQNEGFEPSWEKVEQIYRTFDWVGLTAFFHESKCLLYHRLTANDTNNLPRIVEHYLNTTCHCRRPLEMEIDANTLDEKMIHAPQGHRSTLLDIPSELLAKMDMLSKVDLSLFRRALSDFIAEIVLLERRLGRQVLCSSVLTQWQEELAYTGLSIQDLYQAIRSRADPSLR